jgi:AraC family ethanolamine operon transcriptional activator
MEKMSAMAKTAPADRIQPRARAGMVGEIVADDICVYEQISAPWEILATPRDRKPFGHRKTYLITPSVILYRESFNSCIRVQGLTPPGMLGFSIPLRLGARSTYWNTPPDGASLPASMPGALDSVLDAGQAHIIVLVSLGFVRAVLPDDFAASLENALRGRSLPAAPDAIEEMGRWLLGVLETARQRPEAFQRPASVRAYEEELLARLRGMARLEVRNAPRPAPSCRERGLARAIEFLRANDPATLTVPQLCNAANVSQRSLEYAFREAFGLTPIGYLRLRRFHRARHALLAARQEDACVADTAHQAGFFELGRFAGTYRGLFGESPSATLGRRAPEARGFPPHRP